MHKLIIAAIAILAVAGIVVVAPAAMQATYYSLQVIDTGTNSTAYVLRGDIVGVYVDMPSGTHTGTVKVSTSEATVLEKADILADTLFLPRITGHDAAGAALPNLKTNNVFAVPAAGAVTARVIGQSVGTNTYTVRVIVRQ